jgi:hypothetical protein
MASKFATLTVDDLRGGVNNSDSPSKIAANQVVDARNVDFRDGALGSKRRGTTEFDLTDSSLTPPIVALFRHQPTNNIGNDELWAIDQDGNLDRRVGGTWQGGVAVVNDFVGVSTIVGDENAVSIHGKLFIAAKGSVDRLLVWDGTYLRWAGIQQPPDPTVADTGAGSYTGTRYFRIRYVEQNAAGAVLRRSEPTNAVSLAPSGAGSGALITKPAGTEVTTSLYCEGQTHWEVEASVDNILFYRVSTVAIGTATYTDTTAYSTGYSSNTLSESAGEYLPPHSARHVAADEDRVVMGGHRFTEGYDATFYWTPVQDDDGVGNDERIPATTRNKINLDGLEGGQITALVTGISGNIYVFKLTRIYKLTRTGVLTSAYQPLAESQARGALVMGAVAGTDPAGNPCAYFLDQNVGLCRIGQQGVEDLGWSIRRTWQNRNRLATPRIIFYPELLQVWYWIPVGLSTDVVTSADGTTVLTASGSSIEPNVVQQFVFETRFGANLFHSGLPATTRAAVIFPNTDTFERKPILSVGNRLVTADSGTTDVEQYYRGYVVTRPYQLGGMFEKFGIMAGVLLARASDAIIGLLMRRNYGVEERQVAVSINSAQTHVMQPVDNLSISDCLAVQFEIGDPDYMAGSDLEQEWSLDSLVLRYRNEEGAA